MNGRTTRFMLANFNLEWICICLVCLIVSISFSIHGHFPFSIFPVSFRPKHSTFTIYIKFQPFSLQSFFRDVKCTTWIHHGKWRKIWKQENEMQGEKEKKKQFNSMYFVNTGIGFLIQNTKYKIQSTNSIQFQLALFGKSKNFSCGLCSCSTPFFPFLFSLD